MSLAICREYERITKNIEKWTEKLLTLQDECPHSSVVSKYRSDTGNYDPSEDKYWVEHRCLNCHRKWSTPQ